jgi:prepilin-type N-terminal cleavage/methylation domain-containing protein
MKRISTRTIGAETGLTLIELIIVVGVIGVVSAITVPSVLRARVNANETAVLGSIRAVNSAQAAYAGAASPGGYAVSFSVLVRPCPGSTQGFISPDLALDPGQKSGYTVALGPGTMGPGPTDCNAQATSVGYYMTAVPISPGLTGHRGFASTSPGVIYFTPNGVAPTEAQTLPNGGGTPIQ